MKTFENLLFKEGEILTSTTEIQHEIRITTEEQINSKLYMEKHGNISKSNFRYSSPLIVIPKNMDNLGKRKYRIVVDYKKLNEVTIDDKYPLPNIDSILDKLGRAQPFTTLDLGKGYHQFLVKEDNI